MEPVSSLGTADEFPKTPGNAKPDVDIWGSMTQTVKLSRVQATLAELSYPLAREEAAADLTNVTLLLADGEQNLGEVVAETGSETFESAADLEADVYAHLPVEAVGEPGQSEGEG